MAKKTFTVAVAANTWTALSAGEGTVIVQSTLTGPIKLALAEASGDLGADDGHTIIGGSPSIGSASFTGVPTGVNVYARSAAAVSVIVTRY
jgi:hypothetical protein